VIVCGTVGLGRLRRPRSLGGDLRGDRRCLEVGGLDEFGFLTCACEVWMGKKEGEVVRLTNLNGLAVHFTFDGFFER
jgi:hypothetical protein